MQLDILIIEDEILIAETIKLYLEEQGHQIQMICISYEEAILAYQKQIPDLVILDIRLYGSKSGIDFANFLKQQPEQVPFIYLTSQYDRRIFDLALATNPYGYLAKPIQKETLWMTVETAYRLYQEDNPPSKELIVFDGNKNHKIKEEDIICIKSDHIYANIYLVDGRKIVTRTPLKQLQEQMSIKSLFQCHRSYIINTKHINQWNSSNVTLINGEIIPVSRSKKSSLMRLL